MLIELWRKVVATEYSICCCAICGNDFGRGSVTAMASRDDGGEIGDLCPACLDNLNRRREDAEDPTLVPWPARTWPTTEDLEEARRRYPEPMFATEDELLAAATDREAEARIYEASFVWRVEPESAPA